MHPIFDSTLEPTHEIVLYAHSGTLQNPDFAARLPENIPLLGNNASLEEAITFLASGDLILTDSYHGMYWGTLLGRRVIAFPSSSKFYDVKHPVPLCDPRDWQRFERLTTRYPFALDECRAANISFSQKVAQLIGQQA
jgi:hypothetical protein